MAKTPHSITVNIDDAELKARMWGFLAAAWDEGHETDEHGAGKCECPNPYEKDTP